MRDEPLAKIHRRTLRVRRTLSSQTAKQLLHAQIDQRKLHKLRM